MRCTNVLSKVLLRQGLLRMLGWELDKLLLGALSSF